ncbi:MAG: hypothetical protein J0M12_15360 [Deltaproteobacteria bacterium]|nr:hypothetical protein [Deltaproteobacteria bacterium]
MSLAVQSSLLEQKATLTRSGWVQDGNAWNMFAGGSADLANYPIGSFVSACRLISTDPEVGGSRPYFIHVGQVVPPGSFCAEQGVFTVNLNGNWEAVRT